MPDLEVIPDEVVNDPPPAEAEAPSHEETDTEPENTEELLAEEMERRAEERDATEEAEGANTDEEAEATGEEPDKAEVASTATDETVEVEWGGNKYTVPKGAEAGFMVQADYTQKTQALAETTRELQGREQRFQEQITRSNEDRTLDAQHLGELQQLQEYSQIDWQTWVRQDPDAANPAYMAYQQLQNQAQQTRANIEQRGQQREQEQQSANQADLQSRLAETREYAKAKIPGWSEEVEQQNIDYALEAGIKPQDLQNAMSPAVFQILHDARLGAALRNKPQPRPQAPTKASSTVGNTAGVSLNAMDPEEMTMEQYAKWRGNGR